MTHHPTPPPPPNKAPAASHMLMFFVLPCLGFIVWASWGLIGALLESKPQDIPARIAAVQKARSSGDRWQAVYSLSQELQKMKAKGEWETAVSPEQKSELLKALTEIQVTHSSDLRLKKYVLLTLGQFGTAEVIPFVQKELSSEDDETRFYAAWAFLELLGKTEAHRSAESLAVVRGWLRDKDASFRKIAATFLVQHQKDTSLEDVRKLLNDENIEVRWNTAVALSSVGDESAANVLMEMFDLSKIRNLDLRSLEDLKQLLSSAYEAARKLGREDVLKAAETLKSQVNAETPEGRAIRAALGS